MPDYAAHVPLVHLETPCLLLDETRMERNIARLKARLAALGEAGGVTLRPHLKTAKSIDVARALMPTPQGPATVSTLKEADYFASHGVRDLLYAVAIAPGKLRHVAALRARGVDLTVIVDSVEAARAVAGAGASASAGMPIPALIEIDSDGHRSGVQPQDTAQLLAIARALEEGGAALRGVMTHAGDSYNCRTVEALEAIAEQERAAAVRCATVLREAGLPCPIVSVGSTPTAHFAKSLQGVTEVRAGVFVFFDLVMAGVGVCTPDDIALSVLATVIGHQHAKGWIIVDAGWMALSRDRGTARWAATAPAAAASSGTASSAGTSDAAASAAIARWRRDQGYGLVCDLAGQPFADLIVADANQEHGILALRPGSLGSATLPDLPIGAMVRILPNHACATGAQHDRYHVVTGAGPVRAVWPRINGW
jgi:D-serine deaminase-like pyridoxal phosphate-dependent protein